MSDVCGTQAMLEEGLVGTVRLFCGHPHPSVSSMALQASVGQRSVDP